eukprot:292804_1
MTQWLEPTPDGFDFDKWIQNNNFSEIKHLFIKHNLTTAAKLCVTSAEFRNLMCDKELTAKSHFVAQLFTTISNFKPPQIQQSPPKTIIISEQESNAMNAIKSNIQTLRNLENKIEKIPNAISKLNALKTEKIKNVQRKLKETFDFIEQVLKIKYDNIIQELKEFDLDNINIDNIQQLKN